MRSSRLVRIAVLGILLVGLAGSSVHADLIFLKDGYVLQGTVRREGGVELDPGSKTMIFMPKGFYMVDDGPRRIYFSQAHVRIVEKLAAPVEERVIQRQLSFIFQPQPMLPILDVDSVGEWDLKTWKREFRFSAPGGRNVALIQRLASITPYFARVDAITKFHWSAAYLTREWDPETVHKLLLTNPSFQDPRIPTLEDVLKADRERKIREEKEKLKAKTAVKVEDKDKDKPKDGEKEKEKEKVKELTAEERLKLMLKYRDGQIAARRLRLCDFFAQAGWFDHAERELDRLVKDLPGEKERVNRARETVDRLRARDLWEQTKNWYQSGRYAAVRKRLEKFPTRTIPDKIKADIREMTGRLGRSDALIAEADKFLDEQSRAARDTVRGQQLASAVRIIRKELHPATVDRLDAFLGQARDAARQQGRGKKAIQSPERLLALAVSGWLLGSPSAEADPLRAVNLWKTRQMVIEYLGETDSTQRKKILGDYKDKISPAVDLDEIAQMIDHLPPPDPTTEVPEVTVERTVLTGNRNKVAYYLRLPPEYSHSRPYPVLFVLGNTGAEGKAMINRWAAAAADHGYILVSPKWDKGIGNNYNYSEEEHETVTETLRDLRRRFQVDSDRVFLFGLGEGGKMAFDVGLSHPDLFAGVLPMCAGPDKYPRRYWRNGQYLPFYTVNGTRAADSNPLLREQYEHWVNRSFPMLWVEYKGRGLEWFSGEVPNMFDWMRNQRRAFPLRQLGTDGMGGQFGNEFCTMREGDNRFYWLSTSSINRRNIVAPERWSQLIQPAAMTGRIDPQTNEITIKTQSINQISIWLGRNPKGQYMVDFDKPITVRVGFRVLVNQRRIQPNLGVLLEDLYNRGDRKHLFVARIDLKVN